MSATVEVHKFAKFFPRKFKGKDVPAPIITILSPEKFHVDIFYIEDLVLLGRLSVRFDRPRVAKELMLLCIKLLAQFDVLDYNLPKKEAVLIFLPGVGNIEEMYDLIKEKADSACGASYKWHPIAIHGSVGTDEQSKAFIPAPPGYRKIVIATNVAESSVTMPDISIVIDFCLMKNLVTNPDTNLTKLELFWASKANLAQRAGRVGRVSHGVVYRLIPHKLMKTTIQNYNAPDMTRCLLEKTTLQAIMLGMGNPQKFLAEALDPPSQEDIKRSVLTLKEIGALPLRWPGPVPFLAESVTLLGRLMAVMPIDVRLTRLIILGYSFGVFKEAIIIAACMNTRCLFVSNINQKLKYYKEKLLWANGSCSDSLCFLNLYETWKRHRANGYFKRRGGISETAWAQEHCVQLSSLYDVEKLIGELTDRLRSHGIEEPEGNQKMVWTESERELVLKIVLAGTFYPNYFCQLPSSSHYVEKEAHEALAGRDPFRTVSFSYFPRGESLELYKDVIREYLSECDEEFEITTNYDKKVFIEFPKNRESLRSDNPDVPLDPRISGGISMGVYKVLKLRFAQRQMLLKTLTSADARRKREEIAARKEEEEKEQEEDCIPRTVSFPCNIPPVKTLILPVEVTHVVNPSQFWCISLDERGIELQVDLGIQLDAFKADLKSFRNPPKVGQMCVVKCDKEGGLYRGKIVHVSMHSKVKRVGLKNRGAKSQMKGGEKKPQQEDEDELSWDAEVFLIDTGKTLIIKNDNIMKYSPGLYAATKEIPALAFECTLTKVRPCPLKSPRGEWVSEAIEAFREITTNQPNLYAEVYSIVNEVCSVYLRIFVPEGDKTDDIWINDYLKSVGYAMDCEERWMSEKYNRIRNGEEWLDDKDMWEVKQYMYGDFDHDVVTTERTVSLLGPDNPLDMNLTAYMSERLAYNVSVSGYSVNCVLLNPYSRDEFSRLLVCSRIFQPLNRSGLIVGETTLMPNIPGWATLIPLVFTPTAQFRVNEDTTRYTGALCGLGVNKQGKAYYPEHDMELVFDTELSEDDIAYINRLRFATSAMLVSQFYGDNTLSLADRVRFREIVQDCVRNIFFMRRKVVRREPSATPFTWNTDYDFNHRTEPLFEQFDNLLMLRPLRAVELRNPGNDAYQRETAISRLKYLHELVDSRRESWDNLDCELCEVRCKTVDELGVHFSTEEHKNKEAEFLREVERESGDRPEEK